MDDVGTDREFAKKEFAKRMHQALLAKQWRQADLVRASGIAKDSVSQYYNGRTLPTDLSLLKLAKALSVDPGWLVPDMARPTKAPDSDLFEMLNVPGSSGSKRVRMDKVVPIGTANKIWNLVYSSDADRE